MTETLGDWEKPGAKPSREAKELARRDSLHRDLARLYAEVARIEAELKIEDPLADWVGRRPASFVLAGLLVGFVGAATSLLFHVVGSVAAGGHPLQIVRVYLTIVRGEQALFFDSGRWLAIGTCAYLLAGALYGIPFHLVLGRWFAGAPTIWRLLIGSAMGIGVWFVNFFLILSWLQPLLTGGPSILSFMPFWLAALTHLVYAWTIALMEDFGRPSTTLEP